MTISATAIKTEIRELIDLQIRVFGQSAPLTNWKTVVVGPKELSRSGNSLTRLVSTVSSRNDGGERLKLGCTFSIPAARVTMFGISQLLFSSFQTAVKTTFIHRHFHLRKRSTV